MRARRTTSRDYITVERGRWDGRCGLCGGKAALPGRGDLVALVQDKFILHTGADGTVRHRCPEPETPSMANPLIDVVSMLERYMAAASAECLTLPGHETDCQCVNHVKVRAVHAEAEALLARVKGA